MSFWKKTWEVTKLCGEVALRLTFGDEEGLFHDEREAKDAAEAAKRAEAEKFAREAEESRRALLTPEQRRIEDLERENANLRSQNGDLRDACRKQQDTLDAVKRWAEENS